VNFINTYGQDKAIYGTDYPALSFERTRREIDDLGLRDGSHRKLMFENAKRLYKIDF